MECLVVIEPKSSSRHYSGGVAQFDRAQNSNSKVAIVYDAYVGHISLLCKWGKTPNVTIPTSGGAAQRN